MGDKSTTDGLRPSDRTELARQIFEFACARLGYPYEWSQQDIKTVQQWTTIADFIIEREKAATDELDYFRKFRDELQAANTKLVLENRKFRDELQAAKESLDTIFDHIESTIAIMRIAEEASDRLAALKEKP